MGADNGRRTDLLWFTIGNEALADIHHKVCGGDILEAERRHFLQVDLAPLRPRLYGVASKER
jgi:hypothetical protein